MLAYVGEDTFEPGLRPVTRRSLESLNSGRRVRFRRCDGFFFLFSVVDIKLLEKLLNLVEGFFDRDTVVTVEEDFSAEFTLKLGLTGRCAGFDNGVHATWVDHDWVVGRGEASEGEEFGGHSGDLVFHIVKVILNTHFIM